MSPSEMDIPTEGGTKNYTCTYWNPTHRIVAAVIAILIGGIVVVEKTCQGGPDKAGMPALEERVTEKSQSH